MTTSLTLNMSRRSRTSPTSRQLWKRPRRPRPECASEGRGNRARFARPSNRGSRPRATVLLLNHKEALQASKARRHAFAPEFQRGLYKAIFRRRDIREFIPDPVPDEVLARVLVAAHHAASVGFTQPWDFIIVGDLERRHEVKRIFEQERAKNSEQFEGARREKFLSLKLEGILEAPLNLIVTCEPERFGPGVLGKVSLRDVEVYSTCLAVENLWLAARAEGLGTGWVSIIRNEDLSRIFGIPASVIPLAYLCI